MSTQATRGPADDWRLDPDNTSDPESADDLSSGNGDFSSDDEAKIPAPRGVATSLYVTYLSLAADDPRIDKVGAHTHNLYTALIDAKKIAAGVNQDKLVKVIKRMKVQDGRWRKWQKKKAKGDEVGRMMAEIRHGALTSEEWNIFWAGIGGWMSPKWKVEADRRNRYELQIPVPPAQGWWTRLNNTYARKVIVGPTGDRDDQLEDNILQVNRRRWGKHGRPPGEELQRDTGGLDKHGLKRKIYGEGAPFNEKLFSTTPPVYYTLSTLKGAQRDEDFACMFDTSALCLKMARWSSQERPKWLAYKGRQPHLTDTNLSQIETLTGLINFVYVDPSLIAVTAYCHIEDSLQGPTTRSRKSGVRSRTYTMGQLERDQHSPHSIRKEDSDQVVKELFELATTEMTPNDEGYEGPGQKWPGRSVAYLLEAEKDLATTDVLAKLKAQNLTLPAKDGPKRDLMWAKVAATHASSSGGDLYKRANTYSSGFPLDAEDLAAINHWSALDLNVESIQLLGPADKQGIRDAGPDFPPVGCSRGAQTTLDAMSRDEDDPFNLKSYTADLHLGNIGGSTLHQERFTLGRSSLLVYAQRMKQNGTTFKAVRVYICVEQGPGVNREMKECMSRISQSGYNKAPRDIHYFDARDKDGLQILENCWRPGPENNPLGDEDPICQHPEDHLECVANPTLIARINYERRAQDAHIPKINFYYFVQHEGETVITLPKTWFMVVNIGQSFGVSHNYARPRDAAGLLRRDVDTKACNCPEGTIDGTLDPTTLALRTGEESEAEMDVDRVDSDTSDDDESDEGDEGDEGNEGDEDDHDQDDGSEDMEEGSNEQMDGGSPRDMDTTDGKNHTGGGGEGDQDHQDMEVNNGASGAEGGGEGEERRGEGTDGEYATPPESHRSGAEQGKELGQEKVDESRNGSEQRDEEEMVTL